MPKKSKEPAKNNVLKGRPPNSNAALLLIDIVTDFEFHEGEKLWENARPIAAPIAELKYRARSAGMPVIYVNDNFGNWQEDLERQVERIMRTSEKGREFIRQVQPVKEDFYVLKPQRSGFYKTPLSVLLSSMEVSTLVITGVTTDICVLFTAHDAYMRGFDVWVPSDCTAAAEDSHRSEALQLINRVAGVDIRPSAEIDLIALSTGQKN